MVTLSEGANTVLGGSALSVRVTGAVDLIAVVVGAGGTVASDGDMVFFNQPTAPGLHLVGRTLEVDLAAVRAGVGKIVLVVAPEEQGATFAGLATCVLIEHDGEQVSFAPAHLVSEKVAVIAEVYPRGGAWKVRAVGQGYDAGLAGLARDFGIDVEEGAAAQPPQPQDQIDPGPGGERGGAGGSGRSAGGALVVFDLWDQRGSYVAVAGVVHHKDAVRVVLGPAHRSGGAEHQFSAHLVCDVDNRYDPCAVAVHVQGRRIGWIPGDLAGDYQPVLMELNRQGLLPQVQVRIWARSVSRWDEVAEEAAGTEELYANAWLALGPPHLLAPSNQAPAGGEVLPLGAAVQVGGVGEHLDAVSVYTQRSGEQWVHVSLHEVCEQRARTQRSVVEVRLDGQRVGQLTPKMSEELLPVTRHLAGADRVAGARAMLRGNHLAAKLTLHVARSSELANDWFDQHRR